MWSGGSAVAETGRAATYFSPGGGDILLTSYFRDDHDEINDTFSPRGPAFSGQYSSQCASFGLHQLNSIPFTVAGLLVTGPLPGSTLDPHGAPAIDGCPNKAENGSL